MQETEFEIKIIKESGLALSRDWKHLDPVRKDDVLAIYDDGTKLIAPYDSVMLLPFKDAKEGAELFYLGTPKKLDGLNLEQDKPLKSLGLSSLIAGAAGRFASQRAPELDPTNRVMYNATSPDNEAQAMAPNDHMKMELLRPFGMRTPPAYAAIDAVSVQLQEFKDTYEIMRSRLWLGDKLIEYYPDTTEAETKKKMEECLLGQVNLLKDPGIRDLIDTVRRNEYLQLDDWQRGNFEKFTESYAQLAYFIRNKNPNCVQEYIDVVADAEHVWLDKYGVHDEHKEKLEQAARVREALIGANPQLELPDLPDFKAGENAFEQLTPTLQQMMDLRREAAEETAKEIKELTGKDIKPSEAATMQLNPGVTNADIDRANDQLREGFPELVKSIEARQQQDAETGADKVTDLPEVPEKVQLRIFERILDSYLESIGTSREQLKEKGVDLMPLATTQTGFCWGYPSVQIAVETYPENLLKGVGNAFHEFGHLLYLIQLDKLPEAAKGRPVGQFNGFGVHETAAMFMEQAGLREHAFTLLEPIIREEIKKAQDAGEMPKDIDLSAFDAKNMHKIANRPDLSNMEWCNSELSLAPNMEYRVLAYRMLNDGEIYEKTGKRFTVADMPQLWADTMEKWTGKPHNPRDYMVLESHPTEGLESYFSAYMTGGTAATMMQDEMARKNMAPDAKAKTLAQYISPYANLLDERIFQHGGKHPPMELLERAVGKKLSDPAVLNVYKERLSAAAKGLAPDQALSQKYAKLQATPPRSMPNNYVSM